MKIPFVGFGRMPNGWRKTGVWHLAICFADASSSKGIISRGRGSEIHSIRFSFVLLLIFTFSPVSDNAMAIEDRLLHDDGFMPDQIILLG